MGSLARLISFCLLVLCACRETAGPAQGVVLPDWSQHLPGDTMFVAWRADGGTPGGFTSVYESMAKSGSWRRIATPNLGNAGLIAYAQSEPQKVGWKSLSEVPEFREAVAKLGAAKCAIFESGLWIEPELRKATAALPGVVANKVQEILRAGSVRYLWLAIDEENRLARGAIETTGTESGFAALLGVASRTPVELPALERERSTRLEATLDPAAMRRMLEAFLAGDGDPAKPLAAMVPVGLVQPFLERLTALEGSFAIAADGPEDLVFAARLSDPVPVKEFLEERGRKQGSAWLMAGSWLAVVEGDRLLVFGTKAPEARKAERGSTAPLPGGAVSWRARVRRPEFTGEIAFDRASKTASALAIVVRY